MLKYLIAVALFSSLAFDANAASRFWVGGTGTWDAVTTTNWSATNGGGGGASVPTSADDVTFNGSSGGGTVTVNFGGTVSVKTLTMGAFTGTFDNSVNNNNFAISGTSGTDLNLSGSGTRTVKLGSATYTISGNNSGLDAGTTTNLTFQAGTSVISFTGTGNHTFGGGNLTWGTLSIGAMSTSGLFSLNQSNTFAHVNITSPAYIEVGQSNTNTVTNTVTWNGTASNPIMMSTNSSNATNIWALTAGSTMNWVAFRGFIATTGSPIATNSFDLGDNTGVTFSSGGGGCILGGWLLYRDLPDHLNDNFPAWLEKAS